MSDSCNCKVGRVARRRALDDLPGTLRARWTAGEDRASLRDLSEAFNVAVVRTALSGAGLGASEPEAEAVYRLLTGEETSAGRRTETRRRLARAGVDVETLRDDFVSHQTVHTHLRECADASYDDERTPADRLSSAENRLFALQGRTEAVTREAVASLRSAGVVDVGEVDVVVDVTVTCRNCGRGRSVARLLEERGCPCREG